jgi:hypothetical protein
VQWGMGLVEMRLALGMVGVGVGWLRRRLLLVGGSKCGRQRRIHVRRGFALTNSPTAACKRILQRSAIWVLLIVRMVVRRCALRVGKAGSVGCIR